MLLHGGAGFFLFAHQPYDVGRGADELDVAGLADGGEVGVLREQAVAGMDGVHIRDFGGADDGRNIEITQRQLRRSNANRLVGETHVQRIAVGLAVDGDRADAEFLARANDAQSDLSAIGN